MMQWPPCKGKWKSKVWTAFGEIPLDGFKRGSLGCRLPHGSCEEGATEDNLPVRILQSKSLRWRIGFENLGGHRSTRERDKLVGTSCSASFSIIRRSSFNVMNNSKSTNQSRFNIDFTFWNFARIAQLNELYTAAIVFWLQNVKEYPECRASWGVLLGWKWCQV